MVRHCVFDGTYLGQHGGVAGNGTAAEVSVLGCTFRGVGAGALGFDLSTAAHHTVITVMGCALPAVNNTANARLLVTMPTDATRQVNFYTDLAGSAFGSQGTNAALFWNGVHGPGGLIYTTEASIVSAPGTVVVLRNTLDSSGRGTTAVTTTHGDRFPAVIARNGDETTNNGTFANRLANGDTIGVTMDTVVVAVGDTIVTSVTAGQGTVDNTVTDLTKILGWALQTKAAGSSAVVTARRNRTYV